MTQPSRRRVLRLGVVAALAAGRLSLTERALAAVAPTVLARRTFRPLVGSAFRVLHGNRWYRAVLISVEDLPNSPAGHERRFRLMFRMPDGGPAQGTYRFHGRTLGTIRLFVVPVGGGRRLYEAVIVAA